MAGPSVVADYAGETNYIVFGILKALDYLGILILLQGVSVCS